MSVTKEQVVEFISSMTVLELSEFIKELDAAPAQNRHLTKKPSAFPQQLQ